MYMYICIYIYIYTPMRLETADQGVDHLSRSG